MQVRETTLLFPFVRGSGPQISNETIIFPREVSRAVAAIRGYQVGFSGDDHHVGLLEVALDTSFNQNSVTIAGRLGCRDWSGNWDDDYGGSIQVSILAELVSPSEPPPRGDISVVDVELNQATQYFRAADHLDSGNVRPDNSIPLVAGKATGIRVYVDYDASAGLPPIASLSGELTATSGGATATFAPIAPIIPRRVTEIDRGLPGHTLNFLLPDGWCDGIVEIKIRAFDATMPAQRSAALNRSLRFVRVNPLRVYAVGVNYTGAGLNLPAPVQSDFATTFDYTRRVWPTGDVLFSGYTTIAFSDDLSGTASEGCGSGFSALRGDLEDMKGDTDDLVYGLLPSATPITGVAGCGGSGAGTGLAGDGVTAAHEAGHAFGRKHAPCDDSARCDSPLNTDDDYPKYGVFVSDSVGEFGFDVENNMVFDPATSTDFMGYSSNDWISPYTYAALFAKGDPLPGSSERSLALLFGRGGLGMSDRQAVRARAEWRKERAPVLFLRVRANGKGVEVEPSFSYDAFRRPVGPVSDYEVHVLDEDKEVLACTQLERRCGACGDCGPVDLKGEVPLRGDPRFLVIRLNGEDIETLEFESPIKFDCDWKQSKDGSIQLSWTPDDEKREAWYLVQWQDLDGTWRGLAPRTRNRKAVIPKRYRWATAGSLRLRILAVELLTTSSCEFEIETKASNPSIAMTCYQTHATVGVLATDVLGRQLPSHHLTWHDEHGAQIARGCRIVKSGLQRRVFRVVPFGLGASMAEALIDLDRADEPSTDADVQSHQVVSTPEYRRSTRGGRHADEEE